MTAWAGLQPIQVLYTLMALLEEPLKWWRLAYTACSGQVYDGITPWWLPGQACSLYGSSTPWRDPSGSHLKNGGELLRSSLWWDNTLMTAWAGPHPIQILYTLRPPSGSHLKDGGSPSVQVQPIMG